MRLLTRICWPSLCRPRGAQLKLAEIITAIFSRVMDDRRTGSNDHVFSLQTRVMCYQAAATACFLSEALGGTLEAPLYLLDTGLPRAYPPAHPSGASCTVWRRQRNGRPR